MGRLQPDKLHVTLEPMAEHDGPSVGRCYTLTHSDRTGDLFLTIGPRVNDDQISGIYTRLMRDEVIAQWKVEEVGAVLHVHCHVSGGLTLGPAGMRLAIFRRELPLVLEAFRYGDRALLDARPDLDQAPIMVHFHATQGRYDVTECWGTPGDYQLEG